MVVWFCRLSHANQKQQQKNTKKEKKRELKFKTLILKDREKSKAQKIFIANFIHVYTNLIICILYTKYDLCSVLCGHKKN